MNSSEGGNVEFECNAFGRPQPKFSFYKNGIRKSNNDISKTRLYLHIEKSCVISYAYKTTDHSGPFLVLNVLVIFRTVWD